MDCPKCHTDISESYEPADWSVGINAGWFCDACDLAVGDDGYREPLEDDVGVGSTRDPDKPLGKPISELSTKPGPKNDLGHPDHDRYAEWCRICRSWGYD